MAVNASAPRFANGDQRTSPPDCRPSSVPIISLPCFRAAARAGDAGARGLLARSGCIGMLGLRPVIALGRECPQW